MIATGFRQANSGHFRKQKVDGYIYSQSIWLVYSSHLLILNIKYDEGQNADSEIQKDMDTSLA